jgi:hypothetical protein
MSLVSFINDKNNQDVRDKFKQEFPKPKFNIKQEILAPALTNNYRTVGTAFDYLLRFYLQYLNSASVNTRNKGWIAHNSQLQIREILKALESDTKGKDLPLWIKRIMFNFLKQRGLLTKSPPQREELARLIRHYSTKVDQIISDAEVNYSIFLTTGKINDDIIRSAFLLAQLDPIFRAHIIDENIGIINDRDVEDLRSLIYLVECNTFKANQICLLNPNFEYSYLVGGADADLVVDDMLIDIKTTKKLELTREYFNQIIGYYALYRMGGIIGMPVKHPIKRLGIYFSRYRYLYSINVQDVIDETKFPKFLEWFRQRASAQFA